MIKNIDEQSKSNQINLNDNYSAANQQTIMSINHIIKIKKNYHRITQIKRITL